MLLTVKEAETKLCCQMVKRASSKPVSVDGIVLISCLATGCMAWQWSDSSMEFGFCGLAGLPLELDYEDDDEDKEEKSV